MLIAVNFAHMSLNEADNMSELLVKEKEDWSIMDEFS